MRKGSSKIIAVLDREIARKEAELDTAKRATERIAELTNDVFALKRSRQLIAGDTSKSLQALIAEINAPPAPPSVSANGTGTAAVKPADISIGSAVVTALTNAKKPLKLAKLLTLVRTATANPALSSRSLGAVISQYTAKGKIRRKARGTYELPEVQREETLEGQA